ncbi:biopolymer transporter ExbD [Aliiroseovarius subalbicans]|uniref:ExbD/TolR family protein n=1 Tax=Aliiroseovarius subalbicans TaxID=2925840 RepID=UPI001F59B901|nr:biopolymer transporter ExbD [Aliiroseovarius subalbicans]MCI2399227.1 biopolymer transporter ExbD [Aliiroseovarius subalbicans]
MFRFADPRPRRRPSLTPMIDIVFLLLVFFMLASQFGQDRALRLGLGTGGGEYSGPPRLVSVGAQGIALNGTPTDLVDLAGALSALMQEASDVVVLRPVGGADLQALTDVASTLQAAGFSALVVVE